MADRKCIHCGTVMSEYALSDGICGRCRNIQEQTDYLREQQEGWKKDRERAESKRRDQEIDAFFAAQEQELKARMAELDRYAQARKLKTVYLWHRTLASYLYFKNTCTTNNISRDGYTFAGHIPASSAFDNILSSVSNHVGDFHIHEPDKVFALLFPTATRMIQNASKPIRDAITHTEECLRLTSEFCKRYEGIESRFQNFYQQYKRDERAICISEYGVLGGITARARLSDLDKAKYYKSPDSNNNWYLYCKLSTNDIVITTPDILKTASDTSTYRDRMVDLPMVTHIFYIHNDEEIQSFAFLQKEIDLVYQLDKNFSDSIQRGISSWERTKSKLPSVTRRRKKKHACHLSTVSEC